MGSPTATFDLIDRDLPTDVTDRDLDHMLGLSHVTIKLDEQSVIRHHPLMHTQQHEGSHLSYDVLDIVYEVREWR